MHLKWFLAVLVLESVLPVRGLDNYNDNNNFRQAVAVPEAVLPNGRDVRVWGNLVGGRVATAVLVRDGRDQLAPRRVRVLHILLEAVRAQPSAGPSAETSPRPHRPDIPPGRPQQLPVQFLVTA